MKRSRKIRVDMTVSLADLATSICADNDYSDVIDLIEEIDCQQQDWEFTWQLKGLVDRLMSESQEEKGKINSGH